MKTKILLILIVNVAMNAYAAKKPIELSSKVENVTIYLKNAEIQRSVRVAVPKGESEIIFTGLTEQIISNSLRVSAPKGVSVMAVDFDYHKVKVKPHDSIAILKKEINTIDKKLADYKKELSLLEIEKGVIKDNTVFIHSENIQTAELESNTNFVRKQLRNITSTMFDLKDKERDAILLKNNKIKRISQLKQKQKKLANGAIKVRVKADALINGDFKLVYLSPNAGWAPSYELKVKSMREPLSMVYKANVWQKTKNDWTNIGVIFSSVKQDFSLNAPNLGEYHLNYNQKRLNNVDFSSYYGQVVDEDGPVPGATVTELDRNGKVINGAVTDINGRFSLNMSDYSNRVQISFIGYETVVRHPRKNDKIVLHASNLALQEVVMVGSVGKSSIGKNKSLTEALQGQVSGVNVRNKTKKEAKRDDVVSESVISHTETSNEIAVNYKLTHPFSIKSQRTPRVTDLTKYEIPVDYQHLCVPKLSSNTYLTASILDWSELNIINGEATILYDDTFIGKTFLNTPSASDTMKVSLGVDKDVTVERKQIQTHSKKAFISGKKTETRTWKIYIRNSKNDKINLTVLDQVPVSDLEEIEVNILEISKAKQDLESGELKWELELGPKEEKELTISYEVRFPKNKNLIVE